VSAGEGAGEGGRREGGVRADATMRLYGHTLFYPM
jgi:hypothetical protein